MKKSYNADTAIKKKGNNIPEILGIDINSINIPEHHPRKYFGEMDSLRKSIRRL